MNAALAAGEPPLDLAEAFGREAAIKLKRFVDILAGPGIERGLLGPREVPRLWDRHILNCAAVAELVSAGDRVADVGSGAGLPGLVLAIVRPDVHVTLVESLERRADFLTEASRQLAVANADVVRARAEDLARELRAADRFDIVTARAVAPLDRLATWTLGLLRPGGVLLAVKGARAAAELAQHRARVAEIGGRHAEIVEVGAPPVSATVIRVVRVA